MTTFYFKFQDFINLKLLLNEEKRSSCFSLNLVASMKCVCLLTDCMVLKYLCKHVNICIDKNLLQVMNSCRSSTSNFLNWNRVFLLHVSSNSSVQLQFICTLPLYSGPFLSKWHKWGLRTCVHVFTLLLHVLTLCPTYWTNLRIFLDLTHLQLTQTFLWIMETLRPAEWGCFYLSSFSCNVVLF